jgi:hypothetical protein
MKKVLSFFIIGMALLALAACHNKSSSTSYGLTVEKALLAKTDASGKLTEVTDGKYKLGDKVYFVLLKVGKFEKGTDGMNWFDMDLQVSTPDGKVIFEKKQLLGDSGHAVLTDDTANSPYAIFSTTPKLPAGTYTIKLTIYDKVGKGSASESKTITLSP